MPKATSRLRRFSGSADSATTRATASSVKRIHGSIRAAISGPQLGRRRAAGDQLGQDGHVVAVEVLPVHLAGDAQQVGEGVDRVDGRLVADHPLLAGAVEGGQQQVVDTAEVVEDESLVEAAAGGDGPGAGGGEALLLQRLQGGFDDPALGPLADRPGDQSSRTSFGHLLKVSGQVVGPGEEGGRCRQAHATAGENPEPQPSPSRPGALRRRRNREMRRAGSDPCP